MTTKTTIDTFLNDAEEQLKTVLKEQENYDEMIELVLLPSIREQVETILISHTGVELTETTLSFLGEKKVLNKVCKDLDNVDWRQLGEGMEEKVGELRGKLREKLEEEYVEGLCESHKKELKEEGITDMEGLLKFGQRKYKKTIGVFFIGKILGRTIRKLRLKDLEDLGEKLGYREQTIEELHESHRKQLEEVGIINMESLLNFGTKKYPKIFGRPLIGKILGRACQSISLKDLEDLGEKLGYKEKTIQELHESHRKELEEIGIMDMEILLNFGTLKYQKTFGVSLVGKILGRAIIKITLKDLEDLGEKLGLDDLYESHRKQLKKEGIIDVDGLLNFGLKKYRDAFGQGSIGKILGRSCKGIRLKDLEDLGEKLCYKEKTQEEILDIHRKALEAERITDMESLLNFGPVKYAKLFGLSPIGKILGKSINYITLKHLQDLGEKLWPEVGTDEINHE